MSIINVCLMGIGVVFSGLICIIVLCYIMSFFCRKTIKETPQKNTTPAAQSVTEAPIQNKQEMIAAIAAAVAEDLGTDVSALRILAVKKI